MTAPGIVDVSDWDVRFHEPGGSDANVWLIDPAGDSALFKPVVQKAGRRQGEDWAEKAVEQVAEMLDVPHARIRMAMRGGHAGLLSYDLAPPKHELQAGAVLIGEVDNRLVPRARERLGHNLDNIHRVLADLPAVGLPEGSRRTTSSVDTSCSTLLSPTATVTRRIGESCAPPTAR